VPAAVEEEDTEGHGFADNSNESFDDDEDAQGRGWDSAVDESLDAERGAGHWLIDPADVVAEAA
jgi:hypothetical protein